MNYIQVTIEPVTQEQKDILVALLGTEGFEGFEESDESLKAYIGEDVFEEEALQSITASFKLSYQKEIIPKQNWNEVWESNFQPVTVDDFVAVRADFHEPIQNVEHEIIITPKMSFGTGHHATTYMMIAQMRNLDFTGKSVFDFGTGTGILAILAEKLGASQIIAVDNDDWCIRNSEENIERNNCKHIRLKLIDIVETGKKYDIILANINKNIILAHLGELVSSLLPGGHLLLSGLLQQDEADILHSIEKYNMIHKITVLRDKWICMMFNG